jgi:hypothetical protein
VDAFLIIPIGNVEAAESPVIETAECSIGMAGVEA